MEVHVTTKSSSMVGKVCAVESEGYVSLPFGKINVNMDAANCSTYFGEVYGVLNHGRSCVDAYGTEINMNVSTQVDSAANYIGIYEYAFYNDSSDEIYVDKGSVNCTYNTNSQAQTNTIICYGLWNHANGDITFDSSSLNISLTGDSTNLMGGIGGVGNYASGKINIKSGILNIISEVDSTLAVNGIWNKENGSMNIGDTETTNKDSLKIIVEAKNNSGTVIETDAFDSVKISGGYYKGFIFINTPKEVGTYLGINDGEINNDLIYVECDYLNINNSLIHIYDGIYKVQYMSVDSITLPDSYELSPTVSGELCVNESNKNGWYTEDGLEYWYENNVKQGTTGRGKEIYDSGTDAWYWL